MKNLWKPIPDPTREAELDHVLRVAQLFIDHGRPLPSDIVMRAVDLHPHWQGRDIPAVIVEAQKVAARHRSEVPR